MLNKLLVFNLTLLTEHQIDAAYWHEWTMFLMPGGIQLFVALNMALYLWLLSGFVQFIQRAEQGYFAGFLIAGLGCAVFVIHSAFALADFEQFNLPLSIALIVILPITSVWQILLQRQSRAEFSRNG